MHIIIALIPYNCFLESSFKERDFFALDDMDLDVDDAMTSVPPGEEAIFLSNAGSEQDLLMDIFNSVGHRYDKSLFQN